MREIAMDTETTGLDPATGDRVVEIGGVELVNHTPTGRHFQVYLNPQRAMSEGALKITNITDEFLKDKPLFEDEAHSFLEFIGDARLIFHNAPFDMKFLNFELERAGHAPLSFDRVTDTLVMAREKFPGMRNSLDALCQRFGVDNTGREYHGALLDSLLLADVYLELIGGRQPGLVFQAEDAPAQDRQGRLPQADEAGPRRQRPSPLPPRLNADAHLAHMAFLDKLPAPAKWLAPAEEDDAP
ncbi:MAG: DNA polymerase III subunit epsilon [Parvibaculales bacterium]